MNDASLQMLKVEEVCEPTFTKNDFIFPDNHLKSANDKKMFDIILHPRKQQTILEKVLMDAELGKEVLTKGGNYWKCAKFIKQYHKFYTFKRKPFGGVTCCNAYPEICGGICCMSKRPYFEEGCGCYRRPQNSKHIDNCYDDCCMIFKFESKRKFYLQWINDPNKISLTLFEDNKNKNNKKKGKVHNT